MPRELFDGHGNVVLAYSPVEYATLQTKVAELEKQLKSQKKVAAKKVSTAKPRK